MTQINQLRKQLNFRDFGGLTMEDGRVIKQGLLYRSGALGKLQEEELEIVKQLGIRKILDLRSDREVKRIPDPTIPGAQYQQYSSVVRGHEEIDFSPEGFKDTNQLEVIKQYYAQLLYANESYHILVHDLKAHTVPYLFHCASGKDRTGVAAMLVLMIFGASKETILEEYLKSNEYRAENIAHAFAIRKEEVTGNPHLEELLQMQFGVTKEVGQRVIDTVIDRYGSFEQYLFEEYDLGIGDVRSLRQFYLEPKD